MGVRTSTLPSLSKTFFMRRCRSRAACPGLNSVSVRNQKVLGARVVNVIAGSPAEKAGIREGDVITKFNGRAIESSDELSVAVRRAPGAARPRRRRC